MDKKLENKINQWQNKLLDTSRRNPLVSFRAYKRSTVKIIDEKPAEVYRQLVINNEKFNFGPIEEDTEESNSDIESKNDSTEFDIYDKATLKEKYTDNTLQTNLDIQNLFNNLRNIQYRARDIIDEQGYNNLFLTLGMLNWYDIEHSDKLNRSPLLLVPVKITKKSIRSGFQIQRTDEEPIINLSLQEKLNTNFNLIIPEINDSEKFDPIQYFQKIKELISSNSNWKIKEDIYLGFFSFANFVMFKDLEKFKSIYGGHPIISELAGIKQDLSDEPIGDYISADELDIKRKPHDTYQVLDADSSQQEAIEIIKSGRNAVIQGPPGTGKSQTIVNLISEMLANNKKVLFVCEKMAALEVVYERLKSVDLDKFCLQIHSRKSNKKDILLQLREAYDFKIKQIPTNKQLDELIDYRKKLNDYTHVLHQEIPKIRESFYWLIGQLNSLKDVELLEIDFNKDFDKLDYDKVKNIIEVLETFKDRINQIGLPITHNFWGTEISSTSEQHQQTLKTTLYKYNEHLTKSLEFIKKINLLIGTNIKSITDIDKYSKLIKLFNKKHSINNQSLNIKDAQKYYDSISGIIKKIKKYQKIIGEINIDFEDDFLDKFDFKTTKRLLIKDLSSFLRFFMKEYYETKKNFKSYLKNDDFEFNYDSMLKLCNDALKANKLKLKINNISKDTYKPLGDLWQKENSNIEHIQSMFEWLTEYQSLRVNNSDDKIFRQYILNKEAIPDETGGLFNDLLLIVKNIYKVKKEVDKQLKTNENILYLDGFENEYVENILKKVSIWNNSIEELVDWARFRKAYNKCNSVGLGKYIDELIIQESVPDKIVNQFKKKYYYKIYEDTKKENQILEEFEALTHDKNLDNFIKLDKLQLDIAIERVKSKICSQKPDSDYIGAKSSGLGLLQKQFKLQRGHMALRKLFKKAPQVIHQISPCFMMSPMSVAQYIDPEKFKFDLVIFDEASQIKPEHSVGAIIRGKKLVVTGDEKQLPPTNFFQKLISIEDDVDEEDIMLDSVLDECSVIPSFSQCHLKWHYRSKDESLIQFSNIKFYSNRLFTFPTCDKDNKNLGVELYYIKDAVYDRGGSATNRKEAKILIEHVVDQFKKDPSKSIGVVALSQNQQSALRQEKDLLLKSNPDLHELFEGGNLQNKFFIKNLETVQGDERDIIYISIGYGKDRNNKKPSMNFGPINKVGGERRLNVLISRAKEKVKVFSSITGDDFDLSRTKSLGVKRLKQYLDYAKSNGDINTIYDSPILGNDFDIDNPFERTVYDQLQLAGIDFIPQVGQSGYKIDFGILDPNNKSKFILALECDGASYHSSATARDRDRLRQSVLEDKGWSFHRIWSVDWFENNKREMEKLKKAIINAQSSKKKIDLDSSIELEYKDANNIKKSNDDIKIISYEKYQIKHIGWSEEFYYHADSTWQTEITKFNLLILNILNVESPIHFKQLALRVIEHYNMRTVGSRITRIIERKLNRLKSKDQLDIKGEFIYRKRHKVNFIRKRVNTEMNDNILYVSPNEIENAVIYIIKKEFFIPKEELIVQISKVFGYEHTGQRIKKYLNKIINNLDGKIIEKENNDYKLISMESK